MKLKYAFRGISRNIIFTILIIVQLVFAFNSIYSNLDLNKKVSKDAKMMQKFFSGTKVYNLKDNEGMINFFRNDKINEKSLKKPFDYIKNHPKFLFVENSFYALPIEKFNHYNEFKANRAEWKEKGKNFFNSYSYTVDKNFLKKYKIELEEGRLFKDNEIDKKMKENDILPVVVGHNYKKYFKLGDEFFCCLDKVRKGKIVGIVKENQFMPGYLESTKKYINLNNVILKTPMFEADMVSRCAYKLGGNHILFDENMPKEEIDRVNEEIKQVFRKNLGFEVALNDLSEDVQVENQIFKDQKNIVITTSLVIIIFVCTTLIISMLNSIMKRKKEFGIHIFAGGTLKDIAIITYLEVFLIFFISYIISIPLILNTQKSIDIKLLAVNLIIVIGISIIISIIPIIKIFRLKVNELIKGVD